MRKRISELAGQWSNEIVEYLGPGTEYYKGSDAAGKYY
jgi:hypothetical protein